MQSTGDRHLQEVSPKHAWCRLGHSGLAWPASHRLARVDRLSPLAELAVCVSMSVDLNTGVEGLRHL